MTEAYKLFEEARNQGPNPFKQKTNISADEVWGEVTTDLPSLNQHVDQTIYQAISEVRQKYSDKIGIAIKGDRGTGKSHVIHRIWKTIEREGGAVFAYIPPFTNANRINSHVRFYLAQSFIHTDIRGVTQWQQLAVAMLSTLKGTEFEETYGAYLEKCDDPESLRKYMLATLKTPAKIVEFIDQVVEAILENQIDLDFDFLKSILFLLFKNSSFAQGAKAWIQGTDHPNITKAGLPEFSQQVQDAKSIWFIQQICKLAAVASRPVVICFDQLDSARSGNESGDSPAETIAKCIDQIYFQCSNVITLCCVISDTWRDIEQMGSGIPDRVGQRSVATKPPSAKQMLDLIQMRLDWFYSKKNLNSDDYPLLYPLDTNEITGIASKSPGTRSLMKWCADKFESAVIDGLIINPPDPIEKKQKEFLDTYNELLSRISVPDQDDDKLAAIVACTMAMLPEDGTDSVVVKAVEPLKKPAHDLHLTILGHDSLKQKDVKIGIRICESQNSKTFIAVMKKLLNYDKYELTRGCLVRSTSVPKSWRVGKQLEQKLVDDQGGEVVVPKKDEIKPLTAIYQIYEDAENYSLTKEEVKGFVKKLRLAANNRLIREILSDGVTEA